MLGEEGPLLSVCVEPCVCLAKCECVYAVLGSNNEMSTCLKKKLSKVFMSHWFYMLKIQVFFLKYL